MDALVEVGLTERIEAELPVNVNQMRRLHPVADGKRNLFQDVAPRAAGSKLLFGMPKDWYMSYTDSLICWLMAVVLIVLLMAFGHKLRAGAGSAARRGGRGES